ncbi:putative metalloenzyme, LuxS/M16 peptidase, peptidase M16 [Dioscorea sansibarensis]
MATRKLLSLFRRHRHQCLLPSRSATTAVSPAADLSSAPSDRPPMMLYNQHAAVRSKFKRIDNPDHRFVLYASPHAVRSDHASTFAAPATRVATLLSGLRVATESTLASRTATVGVWIGAGSRFETEETNGTAHFLEHMISKGAVERRL